MTFSCHIFCNSYLVVANVCRTLFTVAKQGTWVQSYASLSIFCNYYFVKFTRIMKNSLELFTISNCIEAHEVHEELQVKLLNCNQILNHGADQNKKAFQSDVYHPLANHTYFGGYQMSVPIWSTWAQCIMGNGHMGTPLNRMTERLKALPSRKFAISSITSNCRHFGRPIICTDIYSQCYFVH